MRACLQALTVSGITVVVAMFLGTTSPAVAQETLETRLGDLEFTEKYGYPTEATAEKLFDEMDFQRASQSYIWALPIVQMAKWQDAHANVFNVENGKIVLYDNYVDKLGILTSNSTTIYLLGMVDLTESGPFVLVEPEGATGGMILDFWQRLLTDTGVIGPFEGKGGKYLLLPPGAEEPENSDDYHVIRATSNNVFFAWRLLGTDPDENNNIIATANSFPFSERDNPPAVEIVRPDGRKWDQVHPRGLAYWEYLAEVLNREVVDDRDRFFMAMLKPLGIEKGTAFEPDDRQKKILKEGAYVGEAMAKANTFHKRFDGVQYTEGSTWHFILLAELDQRMPYYDQIDERASYLYEACTVSKAMQGRIEGLGQAYIGAYHDKDGDWLTGEQTYKLHVPPNPPAKRFWSVTVYDTNTRTMINNELQRPDRSSRSGDLITNEDGSIDIYFGPEAPERKEKNWIPTIKGENWFAYFRFYGPERAYIDRTWVLPDIEKFD
jgi:hypothetical protein